MHTKMILTAAAAALLCLPMALADPYTGPVAITNCAGGVHTASVCLKVPAGATTVAPFINDMTFGSEAGEVSFVISMGGAPTPMTFCPGATLPIPAGATRVIVQVTDPSTSLTACGLVGAGTTGTLGATFS